MNNKIIINMRSFQKLSSHVIRKTETFIEEIQDTRNIVHRTMTPQPLQSRPLGTSHSSPNRHQLPCRIFLNLINDLKSLPFQRWFYFWEKPDRAPNLGCREAESPGWFAVSQKNCTRRDAWVGTLSWWSCQAPVAHSCSLLNHPNSFLGGMFKLYAKSDADSLLYSVSSNATATQYTRSLNGIHCPHWLVQWSCHCSRMLVLVHSPWLPGDTDVVQTILVILTMAGLFPDRPWIISIVFMLIFSLF